jgi:hypothetical protein
MIGRPRIERPSNSERSTAPLAGLPERVLPCEPLDGREREGVGPPHPSRQAAAVTATAITRAISQIDGVGIDARRKWPTERLANLTRRA